MANPFRWLDGRLSLTAACLLFATAFSVFAGDGYLPAVGPVPIRLSTPRPAPPPFSWPPLVQPKPQPPPQPAATNPPVTPPAAPVVDMPPAPLGPLGPLGPAEPEVDTSASSTPPPAPPQPVNPLMPFQGPGAELSAPAPPPALDPQSMLNSLLLVSPKGPGSGSKNPQVIMPAFIPPPPPAAPFPSSHATYEVK